MANLKLHFKAALCLPFSQCISVHMSESKQAMKSMHDVLDTLTRFITAWGAILLDFNKLQVEFVL